jgi:NADPH:quinone reductase-like Zn-dependent oxidoreductase
MEHRLQLELRAVAKAVNSPHSQEVCPMKAVRIHSYGASDELKLEETSMPRVEEGQVLIQVYDAGVNPLDWKIRSGRMKDRMSLSFPMTMGQDFAGEVLEAGKNVEDFKPGDRVVGSAPGAYAEFIVVPARDLGQIPPEVDFVAAAALPTPGLTAWQALIDEAQIESGQKILIQGAAGAVGSFAVQIAKWKGLEVTATSARDEFAYLREAGVDHLIDYRSERFEDREVEYDVVLELIGGETLARSYAVVKEGGVLVETAAALDMEELSRRKIRGVQFLVRHDREQLEKLTDLVREGVLKPRVSRVLPLEDAGEAQDLNQAGRSHGKIVLQVT